MRRAMIGRWMVMGALAPAMLLAACSDDEEETVEPTTTAAAATTESTSAAATTEATATEDGEDDGEGAETALDVEMRDIAFSATELTAAAGDVEIALHNAGAIQHDFTIDEIEAEASVEGDTTEASSGEFDVHVVLEGDQSATLKLSGVPAGEYDFYCSVPGHKEAGMTGKLTVS